MYTYVTDEGKVEMVHSIMTVRILLIDGEKSFVHYLTVLDSDGKSGSIVTKLLLCESHLRTIKSL